MSWLNLRKIESREYLELKQELEALRISFNGLKVEFDLILSKLKFKYKITKRDLKEDTEETKDLSKSILLPE